MDFLSEQERERSLNLLTDSGCCFQAPEGEFFFTSAGRTDLYVNTDFLWVNPASFQETLGLLEGVLRRISPFSAIAAAIGLAVPIGMLPLASALSNRLEIPLIIWREMGAGESLAVGQIEPGTNVLIIHDVTVRGHVVEWMANAIAKREKKAVVRSAITVVDREKGAIRRLRKDFGIEVFPMVTETEIREKLQMR